MLEPTAQTPLEPAEAAAAGLVYVSDADPGIRRVRKGDKFRYVAPDGSAVRNEAVLTRIRKLAIPPAYERVWICTEARGHLQATGRDARGRKQYRYHAEWRTTRDSGKFQRMHDFGQRLPKLRRRLKRDLALPGLSRDKILATVVSLLDSTLLRIGNHEYARSNKSFGLTTLRDKHVEILPKGRAQFRFRGKSGQLQELEVDDARLVRIVKHCQQLPGQQLFQYVDDEGQRQPIDSGMVNAYLREAMDEDFTAKDFRTWGGTLRALALMSCTALPEQPSERALTSCIADAVKQVAAELGNTPAVCRNSYIHPAVFEAWRSGALHLPAPSESGNGLRKAEAFTLAFLRMQRKKRAITAVNKSRTRLRSGSAR